MDYLERDFAYFERGRSLSTLKNKIHKKKYLKILIHDYAGHPFQTSLSNELARFGHEVVHAYFAQDEGPKGKMTSTVFKFFPISIKSEYSKKNFIARRFGDIEYGKEVAKLIKDFKPNVILSGNTPTEAQEIIIKSSKKMELLLFIGVRIFTLLQQT